MSDEHLSPSAIVEHLGRARRVFQRVPTAQLERLVAYVCRDGRAVRDCEPGEVVFLPGQPAREMFVVLSGVFEERMEAEPDSELLWEAGPGDVIGEIELFAKHPGAVDRDPGRDPARLTSFWCAQRGRVLVIDEDEAEALVRQSGDFAVALLNAVATDAWRLIEDERRDNRIVQTYFDGRLARLVPAPYRAERVEMNVFLAQTRTGDYEGFVPPGLSTAPGGLFLLVFAEFPRFYQPARPAAQPFSYRETAFFVPARMLAGPAAWRPLLAYAPAVYPDNFMALVLGREIYGFRKRNARTELPSGPDQPPAGALRRAWLELDGARAARVDYRLVAAATSLPAALLELAEGLGLPGLNVLLELVGDGPLAKPIEVPVVNLKQIPGPRHRDGVIDYEVNELCLTPFRIRRVRGVDLLAADGLALSGRVPFEGARLACPFGLRVTMDVDLETGAVVRRYDADTEPLPEPSAGTSAGAGVFPPAPVGSVARRIVGSLLARWRPTQP
jgi:CRP-like cAMP-binding protein